MRAFVIQSLGILGDVVCLAMTPLSSRSWVPQIRVGGEKESQAKLLHDRTPIQENCRKGKREMPHREMIRQRTQPTTPRGEVSRREAAETVVALPRHFSAHDIPPAYETALFEPQEGIRGTNDRCESAHLAGRILPRHPPRSGQEAFFFSVLWRLSSGHIQGDILAGRGGCVWPVCGWGNDWAAMSGRLEISC